MEKQSVLHILSACL